MTRSWRGSQSGFPLLITPKKETYDGPAWRLMSTVTRCVHHCLLERPWYLVVAYRGNGGIHRGIYQLQGDDNGHVGRPR